MVGDTATLATIEDILALPGLRNPVTAPTAFLNRTLKAADGTVKRYLKRDPELHAYLEPYSGDGQVELVLRQRPVWYAQTRVAAASYGAVLPQATINVLSTAGFDPGTVGDPAAVPPTLTVQVGVNSYTAVTYTGVLPNRANPTAAPAFTGCAGGAGTLPTSTTNNFVVTPTVWLDFNAMGGQAPGSGTYTPYADGTIQAPGQVWVVDRPRYEGPGQNGGTKGYSGMLRRLGTGTGVGAGGWWPGGFGGGLTGRGGKLGASAEAGWPYGQLNLQVAYSAGYLASRLPEEIRAATAMLAAWLVRNAPSGAPLSSEGLGGYSYSVLTGDKTDPDLGEIRGLLRPHRESVW